MRWCSTRRASAASWVSWYSPVAGALFCFEAEAAEHVVGLVVAEAEVLGQVGEEDLAGEAVPELPDVGEAGVAAGYAGGIRYGDGGDGPVGHPASSGSRVDAQLGGDTLGVAQWVVGVAGIDQPAGRGEGGVDVVGPSEGGVGGAPVDAPDGRES